MDGWMGGREGGRKMQYMLLTVQQWTVLKSTVQTFLSKVIKNTVQHQLSQRQSPKPLIIRTTAGKKKGYHVLNFPITGYYTEILLSQLQHLFIFYFSYKCVDLLLKLYKTIR
jgi:hypothetical protein